MPAETDDGHDDDADGLIGHFRCELGNKKKKIQVWQINMLACGRWINVIKEIKEA